MKYRIYSRRAYLDNNGEKKVVFYKAGYLRVREDGAMFMRMYNQPDTSFQVFTSKEDEDIAFKRD